MGGAPNRVRRWLKQLAAALAHVHSQRVIHRDVKTANIFLTDDDDSVKLGDFGISRLLSSNRARRHLRRHAYYHPQNSSPARATTAGPMCGPWVIAHECVALSRPFSGENISQPLWRSCANRRRRCRRRHLKTLPSWWQPACRKKRAAPDRRTPLASPPMARWDDTTEGGGGQRGGAMEVPYVGEEQSIETLAVASFRKDSPRAEVIRGAAAAAAASTAARRPPPGAPASVPVGKRRRRHPLWQLVEELNGLDVQQLSLSRTAAAALSVDGSLYLWGTPTPTTIIGSPRRGGRRGSRRRPTRHRSPPSPSVVAASSLPAVAIGRAWEWCEGEAAPVPLPPLAGIR